MAVDGEIATQASQPSDGISLPRVAVILVSFNGFELTDACVASLLQTKYPNLRIVIVDNGSDSAVVSSLEDLAGREPSVILEALGYNSGFSKANNIGIRMALEWGAECLWVLNNDTEVRADSIELFLKAYAEHSLPVHDTLLSSIITYYDNDNIWCNGLRDLRFFNFPRSVDKLKPAAEVARPGVVLKAAPYCNGCSMFFRREFVERHGFMNENHFMYYDDLDYSFQKNNVFIQQPLVKHKVSSSAGFKGSARFRPLQARLYARNGIQFYFWRKRIPWYEKIIYLGFTTWVFVLLYVRDVRTLMAHIKGLWEGLTQTRPRKE